MEAAGRLADGVQAADVGAVILGADPDAAHRVVRGRGDLDGFARDVEHLQIEERLVDPGEPVHDRLAGQVGDVEPDPAVGGAAAFLDLGVGGEGHAVTGGQFHPLRVVAAHVPLAEGVAQDAALAAGRLADEGAGGVLRFDDAGGVELDQFGVAQAGPGLDRQAEGVACVLVPPRRGAPPDAGVPAGREDDGVRVDEVTGAIVEVEAVGPEDGAVVDQ